MSIKWTRKSESKLPFSLVWGKPAIMRMRTKRIVEAGDVRKQTLLQLIDGLKMPAIQLLLLQILEKTLHNGVIVWMPLCREGLNHVEAIDFLAKIGRGELRTSVYVEHDTLGNAPELHCIPQSINGEETVDFSA